MHTVMRDKHDGLWTVGYWVEEANPRGATVAGASWHPLRDFSTEKMAHAFCNYLNGGNGAFFNDEYWT